MTLAPLATVADLSDRGITTGSLGTALAVASGAIRAAAESAISQKTSTVVVNAGRGNLLGLPGPVVSVASVTVAGAAVADFETLPCGLWRHCGWGITPQRVTVTYTHGLAVIPPDIVDLTCVLAKSWLDHVAEGGRSVAGLKSVRIDDGAESYTDEAAGQVSPTFIPEATRNWLRSRFGGGTDVVETL